MRNKETYELTVTSKLEALPLPNLENAIWSRIEAQLDIDMPTDDGDGGNTPTPGSPSGSWWLKGTGLFILAVAIISFFTLTKSKNENVPASNSGEIIPSNSDSIAQEKPPPDPIIQQTPTQIPPSITSDNSKDPVISIDSNASTTSIPPPIAKDSQQVVNSPPVSFTPIRDSGTTKKKPRGVKGITDADYRIVPSKKDSN